ncbi:hypothetical protein KI387_025019, partial [Taxus chinensis]
AKVQVSKDAFLTDICMGTSAAPVYFPAYYFETSYSSGNKRSFNLVDGGLVANNPSMLAINEVIKQEVQKSSEFPSMNPQDYSKFLVISLGTGQKAGGSYNAKDVSKWNMLKWLYNDGEMPIINMYGKASEDVVDINLCVVFQAFNSLNNYLRIQ